MFKKLKEFRIRFIEFKQSPTIHRELDVILSAASETTSLEDQLHWLVKLLSWIRHSFGGEKQALPRLKFVLMVLDRNPHWKKNVAIILRNIVQRVSGLELYTEMGFAKELGLWSELVHRLTLKLLPTPPLDSELSHLFWALFPNQEDPDWISKIDSETFEKIVDLFYFEAQESQTLWNCLRSDLEDAMGYMVIQTRAIGLSPAIRHRLREAHFRESAFYALENAFEDFILNYNNSAVALSKASILRKLIDCCREELDQVYKHLDEFGVSVNLVFQMMRAKAYLSRVENLLDILISEKAETAKVTGFLANLVRENQELRSTQSLISQNISLLANKVVERAAETGEHYITRTKEQYRHMLQAAGGGGAITAFTVYLKVAILALGLSGFMEGVFASLNYAVSFVLIHLLGFTLGTKQPAMTAPALAEKMRNVGTESGMDDLVTEITHLIRSQVASILGNVLFVVPCVLLIDTVAAFLFGGHLMPLEKAHYAYKSVDVFGPAFIFAGFTGVLLWISSLVAGWGDNWFALHSLRKTLARSPSLRVLFGKMGARRIAVFLNDNISGLVGNISLGILLGMTPEVFKFIGLPLDIRHVTLSSGNLAGALPVLGVDFLATGLFWRAVVGIALIGFMNVAVSFGLALAVAIKARGINTPQKRAIRRAVWQRFCKSPWSFFLPVGRDVSSQ